MSANDPISLHNPAPTDHPVNPLVRERWSPRAFTGKTVDRHLIAQLFEAARWAPSSYNDQPWGFIFGEKGSEGYARILDSLIPFNQAWAQSAPLLIAGIARKHMRHNGAMNHHALFDLGQSVGIMLMEATSLGLAVHQMAGFDFAKLRSNLSIPDSHEIGSVIAVGYVGSADTLPAEMKERELAPRSRHPLAESVFEGAFGHAAHFPTA